MLGRRLSAEPPEYPRLQGIGILELVHQDAGEARGEGAAHVVVIAQQIARSKDQVVEIEERRRSLVVAKAIDDRLHERDRRGQHMRGDGLVHRRPGGAPPGIVRAGQVVQPITIGLG